MFFCDKKYFMIKSIWFGSIFFIFLIYCDLFRLKNWGGVKNTNATFSVSSPKAEFLEAINRLIII